MVESKPAVKPRWSPNTKDADTAKATLMILPRRSMPPIIWNMGMLLARVATMPAAATSFMPSRPPSFIRGLRNTLVITYTRGKAPASTMAMSPTISTPSEMGFSPGIRVRGVSSWMMAAARPMVMMMTMILPNTWKPFTMPPGMRNSPRAMSTAMSTMGIRLRSTMLRGKSAARPPTKLPMGTVTTPASTPVARWGRSSAWMMPRPTGMVNTMVGPSMEPTISPPNWPASWVRASSRARGAPPMSLARMVPANMAGSAPRNRYTGTTTGRSRLASTGARQMMPIMARAREPMARMPSSNFSPRPNLLPRILSMAPRAMNSTMR